MQTSIAKKLHNRVSLSHFILRIQTNLRAAGESTTWEDFRHSGDWQNLKSILDDGGMLRFKRQWIIVEQVCPNRAEQGAFCYCLTFQTYLDMNRDNPGHIFQPNHGAFGLTREQAQAVEDIVVKANNVILEADS